MEIIIDKIKYALCAEENGAYVVENHYKGEVHIPAHISVNGQSIPVIGIAEDAFYSCDDVTSVTLPDGLQTIENSAFESMNGLRAIVIPDTVNHIGELAFSDCQNLQQVTLPAGLKHLSADLFESCHALEQIILPQGVKTIGYGCFAACQSLQRIVLPEGLERIDSRAFDMCESLTDIHIPSTVREIGEAAFYACHSLQRIALPEGLTFVPVDCFALCQSLEHIDIPASVQLVEAGALDQTPYHRQGIHYAHDLLVSVGSVDTPDGCLTIPEGIRVVCDTAVSDHDHTLRRVVCPSSLRQIGRCAFRYSHNLEEVVLNEGLEFIDGGAFADCKKLRRIYIPSTVKRIETNPFSCCDMLEEIVVSPDNPYFDSRANCNAILETATNRLIAACRTSHIPDDTQVIGAVAFADIDTLEQLTLPASVTRIEWNAFNGCKNLSEVVFPSQLSYVGEEAFHHTAWLAKQPQGMVIMGKVLYQYRSCGTIFFEPDCVIPEGIEYIARYAFQWLQYPMRVFLPRSLKSCAPGAFYSLDYEPILIRPEGVPADYPCTDTTCHSAWIDGLFYVLDDFCKTATVTRPYERQLYRGHIRIPEQVSYEGLTYTVNCIGHRAFAFDDQYAYFVFEEKDLGRVVDGCSVLESPCYVEIPASVTRIEDEAFLRCFDLCCVQLHGETSIGLDAFKDCHGLQTILVPTDLVEQYHQQHSALRETISDCVSQIDGIFYQLDSQEKKARVVAHYHSNEEKYAQYTGHITIPASVAYKGLTYQVVAISANAFYQSSIEAIDLPHGLETIGREAFTYCENLRYLDVPGTVTTIGEAAFAGCESLRYVRLSEGLRLMRPELFAGCSQLQTVLLGSQIKNIGTKAFSDCEQLRTIYLPETVKKICPGAFYNCSHLKELRIPDAVHIFDMNTLAYCDELSTLIFGPNITGITPIKDNQYLCPTIYVPRDKVDTYCYLGLEGMRDQVHSIEEMEEKSFDELMDWYVQWQLSQDRDDLPTHDDTVRHEE